MSAPGVAILTGAGASTVLPQVFLRLFVAGWLYNYSSPLFVGDHRLLSLVARRRIQCMIFGRSPLQEGLQKVTGL